MSNARAIEPYMPADKNDIFITPGQINVKIIFKPAPVPAMSTTPQRNNVYSPHKECMTKGMKSANGIDKIHQSSSPIQVKENISTCKKKP